MMSLSSKICVALPCRENPHGAFETIKAFVSTAQQKDRIQFGVVDDGSINSPIDEKALQALAKKLGVEIRFIAQEWSGVAKARNVAARICDAPIILTTDCHTTPSESWDNAIEQALNDDVILALTIRDTDSKFKGYGCNLVIPFMGTHWVRNKPKHLAKTPVASSAGTALSRQLFERLGGFDEGMRVYGAIEPEFSVRGWLFGAEVRSLPNVYITHLFKTQSEVKVHLTSNRVNMIHNSLRFGICYLDEARIMQMLRYYSIKFPTEFPPALDLLNQSDVWERREQIQTASNRSFLWLCQTFRIRDHAGEPAWLPVDTSSLVMG